MVGRLKCKREQVGRRNVVVVYRGCEIVKEKQCCARCEGRGVGRINVWLSQCDRVRDGDQPQM